MAARKRNIASAKRSDGNKSTRATAKKQTAQKISQNNANNTASRLMNILVLLFIIAMLNPLLFNAVTYIQSYGSIVHKLTPKRHFPHGWESFTYHDIRDYFNCRERSNDNDKALPTLDEWNLLRQAYTLIVDDTQKWDDPIPPTQGYSFSHTSGSSNNNGVATPPPNYAKQSKGKGRGLFASRNITKGELVHNGLLSDIIFPGYGAIKWKEFVFSLPRDLACDCTDWHWMQIKHEDDDYHMVAALDISILMNSGGEEFGSDRIMTPNVLPEDKYSGRQFAVRDIRKDEEILTDYDAYWTDWSEVGL
eukprot:CAMPEP_0201732160 /NCGR_PEP_ID=MMETSP0593-20130828/28067_1 /ASSEMBLY_ACC=CAM_ASM_000672 /TAXON_ID=267983 /ORGANISM="Skeletonema japonicum, Strain CCMP2506" /LENGTH=305 /DNA_ID=CAMNT_0048225083 /DNA_START=27 /DNA_END=944 /DNA_ORIENTATION=-